jgi:hypothetical protein
MVLVIYAMAFSVFHFGILMFGNFLVRKKAIKNDGLNFKYFQVYDSVKYPVPEFTARYARHVDNHFQLPPLFLITCLAGLHIAVNPQIFAVLAWVFVVSRLIHSYIHLGSNNILARAGAYGLGLTVVMIMWVILVWQVAVPYVI